MSTTPRLPDIDHNAIPGEVPAGRLGTIVISVSGLLIDGLLLRLERAVVPSTPHASLRQPPRWSGSPHVSTR